MIRSIRGWLFTATILGLSACGQPMSTDGGDARTDVPSDVRSSDSSTGDTGTDVVGTDVIVNDVIATDADDTVVPPDAKPLDTGVHDVFDPDAIATDVVMTDIVTADDPGTDVVGVDTADAVSPDVSTIPMPCAAASIVNLNTAGTLTGATTRYSSTNVGTPAASFFMGTCGRPGHEIATTYTPRMTGVLRISTDNPGTNMNFDTVVFAGAACTPAGANNLGCNDDNGTAPRTRASVFTTTRVMAGVPIFIIVAGFTPATGAPWIDSGAFELSV